MSHGEPHRTENDSFDNSSDLPLMILIKKTMKRMKFKTTDTIKEVLHTIAEKETLSHPKEYYGLFLCNDGIFMREERTLGSYYLVKMESIRVKKFEKSTQIVKVLLPSGETEEIAFYDATTARGVLRDIHLKPATYTQNIPTLTYVTPSGKELTLSESDNIGLREGIKSNMLLTYGEKAQNKRVLPQRAVTRSNSDLQFPQPNQPNQPDSSSSSSFNKSNLKGSGNFGVQLRSIRSNLRTSDDVGGTLTKSMSSEFTSLGDRNTSTSSGARKDSPISILSTNSTNGDNNSNSGSNNDNKAEKCNNEKSNNNNNENIKLRKEKKKKSENEDKKKTTKTSHNNNHNNNNNSNNAGNNNSVDAKSENNTENHHHHHHHHGDNHNRVANETTHHQPDLPIDDQNKNNNSTQVVVQLRASADDLKKALENTQSNDHTNPGTPKLSDSQIRALTNSPDRVLRKYKAVPKLKEIADGSQSIDTALTLKNLKDGSMNEYVHKREERKKRRSGSSMEEKNTIPQSKSDFDLKESKDNIKDEKDEKDLSLNLSNSKRSSSIISPRGKKSLKEQFETSTSRQSRSRSVFEEPVNIKTSSKESESSSHEKQSTSKKAIVINVLVEEVRKTLRVNTELDSKVSTLFQTIVQQMEETSEISLTHSVENYTLFHPIKNKMSSSATVKYYNLKNEDLVIFKERKHINNKADLKSSLKLSSAMDSSSASHKSSEKIERAEMKKSGGEKEKHDVKKLISRIKNSTSLSNIASRAKNDVEVKCIDVNVIRRLVRTLIVNNAEKEEGIFRISGSTEKILQIIANIYQPEFKLHIYGSHEIAGTLKFIFRTSEEPLIPSASYHTFLACHDGNSVDRDVLRDNIRNLSDDKRHILGVVMSYLNSVAENAEVNLMTRQNIAIVFGPSLLRTNTSDPILNFSRTGSLSDIVECMIEYHKDFFEEEEMNPGAFTPRKPKEDASVNYLKVLSDLQSQSSLSDLSGYDNFLALINEDEDFSVYLESYSKKEIIQVLTKVVFNTLKASQAIPLQVSSAEASQS